MMKSATDWRAVLGGFWFGAAGVALGLALQILGRLNCNVSWFITMAEAVRDGGAPYVDTSDPNPPAAILLYRPAVALAQLIGGTAEFWTGASITVAFLVSLRLALRILEEAGLLEGASRGLFQNAALWIGFVAVGAAFADREHFAFAFVLPLLSVLIVRFCKHTPRFALSVVAGLIGAFAIAVKPHFAMAFVAPALVAAFAARSWRPVLSIEAFVCALGVAAYGFMVWRFYPGYIEYALPDAMAVYGGARHSVGVVASSPLTIYTVVAMGFAAFVALAQSPGARGALEGPVWILLAAAAGFFAAFMAQSKLAMNQAYIAWAPALLALGWLWAQRTNMFDGPAARFARLFAAPVICAAFLISGGHFNLGLGADDQALARALRAAAPAGARIAAITEDMDLNFPLVRQVGGKWVGRQNSLWRVNCAGRLLERGVTEPTASLARAMINRDMQELVDDIAKGAPDVVLAQSSRLRELVAKRTGASHFLDDYERVAQVEETEVWRRKENVMGGRKTALSVEAE